MNYIYLLLLLIFLLIGLTIWLLFVRGEKRLFTKRSNRFFLFTFLIFAVLGSTGLFIDRPFQWNNTIALSYILQFIFLGFGLLHNRLLDRYHRWNDDHAMRITLPFSLLTAVIAALGFFSIFWLTERPFFKEVDGVADNLTASLIIGLLPFGVRLAHQYWNKIPIVREEIVPWQLDLSKPVPVPEPNPRRSLRLLLSIPLKYQESKRIEFNISANLNSQLGDLFYHILHQHNIQEGRAQQIEFAKDNKRDQIYGWVFFQKGKKWWWETKSYIDPYDQIQSTKLRNGDQIFVERVPTWEQ